MHISAGCGWLRVVETVRDLPWHVAPQVRDVATAGVCSDMSLTPGNSCVARGISARNAARYTRDFPGVKDMSLQEQACSDMLILENLISDVARSERRNMTLQRYSATALLYPRMGRPLVLSIKY